MAGPSTGEIRGKAVCFVFLPGGWHGRFLTADMHAAAGADNLRFGATAGNTARVGASNLYLDAATFGSLTRRANMGVLGIRTTTADHPGAQINMAGFSFAELADCAPRRLAAAMVGQAYDPLAHANACALLGVHRSLGGSQRRSLIRELPADAPMRDLRIQQFSDLGNLLGAAAPVDDPNAAARAAAADDLDAAQRMSQPVLARHARGTTSLAGAYDSAIASLRAEPMQTFTPYEDIAPAYSDIAINGGAVRPADLSGEIFHFATKMAAAEFAIRNCGTKVAVVIDGEIDGRGDPESLDWDTHQGITGGGGAVSLQERMVRRIIPAIEAFTTRMAASGIDVTTVIASEFTRGVDPTDGPGQGLATSSIHGGAAVAAVIGSAFQAGTTAQLSVTGRTQLANPDGYDANWSPLYSLVARGVGLSAAANPFSVTAGRQDHASLLA
ncbi:MAG: hypothetical protein R2939_05640 [Kofleriaceae bacterium]